MRIIILLCMSLITLLGQQSQRERPNIPQPSELMTTTLPAQDITLTIHVSSEIATALEKRRLDNYAVVPSPDGQTSVLKAALPTIADQLVFDLQRSYILQLLSRYPDKNTKAAQDAVQVAQKAAQDAANKASTITRK